MSTNSDIQADDMVLTPWVTIIILDLARYYRTHHVLVEEGPWTLPTPLAFCSPPLLLMTYVHTY